MFLHIGGDYEIRKKDIVSILDLDNISISLRTRKFLSEQEKNGKIITISADALPKSLIITENKFGNKIYISPISSQTLMGRIKKGMTE